MITGRFFIENKEVIGLWIIYVIVMLLVYCILETLVNSITVKIKRARRIKKRKMQRDDELARLANRARVHSQILAVWTAEV